MNEHLTQEPFYGNDRVQNCSKIIQICCSLEVIENLPYPIWQYS